MSYLLMLSVILLALLVVLESYIGIEMVNTPPTTNRRKWLYRVSFFVIGFGIIALTCMQFYDTQKIQTENSNKINALAQEADKINAQQAAMAQEQQILVGALSTNVSLRPDMRQHILESKIKFESVNSQADDLNAWVGKWIDMRALLQAQKEQARAEDLEAAQSQYAISSPCYNYAVNKLANMLDAVATHNADRAVSNFQGFPTAVDLDVVETNVAEIKFQTNPNWDFQAVLGRRQSDGRRCLTISSKIGFIDLMATPGGEQYCTWLHISGQDIIPNSQPFTDYKTTIAGALQYFIAAQFTQFGLTNKPSAL